jgi:hypothetical protein
MLRNVNQLAEEMGTSLEMIRSHYDAVVSAKIAPHWWAIQPAQPSNVVLKPPLKLREVISLYE